MRHEETVIVTGSSGLIGSAVVRRLARRYNIVGFDRAHPPHPPIEAEWVPFDLADRASMERALGRVKYAWGTRLASVVHLAAYYDFSGEASPLYDELTVEGTRRLLEALAPFALDQFVFSSTMLVHAPTEPGRPIDEDSPLEAKWAYPESKIKAEQVIRRHRDGARALILRIAGVYDEMCRSIPLAHQVQRIRERRLISRIYPGETAHGQAFVHLDDVVEAIALGVEKRRGLPEELALLIGEPVTPSYDELQRRLGRLIHDEEWETRQIPKPLAQAGAWVRDVNPFDDPFIKPWMIGIADDHYELDIRRAREHLGWTPRRSLRETLGPMVAAMQADPARWYRENKLEAPAEVRDQEG